MGINFTPLPRHCEGSLSLEDDETISNPGDCRALWARNDRYEKEEIIGRGKNQGCDEDLESFKIHVRL